MSSSSTAILSCHLSLSLSPLYPRRFSRRRERGKFVETLHSTTFPRLPFINQHQPEYRENRQRANRRRDTRTWLHDREPRSLLTTPRTVTPPLPLCFETSALQLLATNHERGSHREREREREISVSAADLYPARVKKKKSRKQDSPISNFQFAPTPIPAILFAPSLVN